VNDVLGGFGRIDILVNNAGVVSRIGEWELTPEEWDRVHDVDLRATFFNSRDAAVAMRENGGGAIINVSSIAGQHGV
jgi:NAD(P)-dependent dehydrogenase (short-subunit alcohol dehydrogenase family)